MKRTVATLALGGFAVLAGAAGRGLRAPVNLASPGLVPVTVTDPSASIDGVKPARSGLVEGASSPTTTSRR